MSPLLNSFRIALVFLTTLPVAWPSGATVADRRRSLYCYPLVGLVVGALFWVLTAILPGAGWLSAALILTAWVVVTGALHLDGLVDAVDAWVGGAGSRDRTLRILGDPAAGSMGVVAVVLVLLLKLTAIEQLLKTGDTAFLVAVPMIARAAPLLLFAATPYLRSNGLGATLRPIAGERHLLYLSLATTGFLGLAFLGLPVVVCLLSAAAVFLLVNHATRRRLGGFTGDIAGALVELVEVSVLVAMALATLR